MFLPILLSALVLAPVAPAKRTAARAAVKSPVHATRAAAKAAPHTAEVLPFIADDWPRAVALAKARKVPLFVEAWAPW